MYVKVYGKKIDVKEKLLKLYDMNIHDIFDIKGLENFTELEFLLLDNNSITEIKGLEALTNLKTLTLSNNKISEIKGLESTSSVHLLINIYYPITPSCIRDICMNMINIIK